jgi:hypothetical protein
VSLTRVDNNPSPAVRWRRTNSLSVSPLSHRASNCVRLSPLQRGIDWRGDWILLPFTTDPFCYTKHKILYGKRSPSIGDGGTLLFVAMDWLGGGQGETRLTSPKSPSSPSSIHCRCPSPCWIGIGQLTPPPLPGHRNWSPNLVIESAVNQWDMENTRLANLLVQFAHTFMTVVCFMVAPELGTWKFVEKGIAIPAIIFLIFRLKIEEISLHGTISHSSDELYTSPVYRAIQSLRIICCGYCKGWWA